MKIVNLTPHSVVVVDCNGNEVLTIPASGEVARVDAIIATTETLEFEGVSVPTTETKWGEVTGLPAPKEGTVYIVSSLVAQRVPERKDVFVPNESVRDESGRIIGCRSLGR